MNKSLLKIRADILGLIRKGKKTMEFRKLDKDYIQVGHRVYLYPFNRRRPLEVVITDKVYMTPKGAEQIAETTEDREFIINNYREELMLVAFKVKVIPKSQGGQEFEETF